MKKGLILIFITLLLIPLVNATIEINGPSFQKYNLGDRLDISGFVERTNPFDGFIEFELVCGIDVFQLPSIAVSLDAGERKDFPGTIIIPNLIIPSTAEGTCSLFAHLIQDGNVIESAESTSFEATKELRGDFSLDQGRIQIGGTFILRGNVFKLNGLTTDGSLEIYFESNFTRFLVDVVNTINGNLTYLYTATAIPAGIYEIDLSLRDVNGNFQEFDNVASFTLINEINVFAKTDKVNIKPGTIINIFGEVRTILQEDVNEGEVTINLANNTFKTNLEESKFDFDLLIPQNIKSGKHQIIVKVEDLVGNKGQNELNIFIEGIPTTLDVKLDKETYTQNDIVVLTPLLYDQADELITENIQVEIKSPKGDIVLEELIPSNSEIKFELPQFFKPGTYKVKLNALELSHQETFTIESISDLQVTLINQTLVLKNVGNVDYKNPIKIDFSGQYSTVKKLSLDPNEATNIDLTEVVPSGTYNIVVTYGTEEKVFNDVTIIGEEEFNFNTLYVVLLVIVIAILAIIFNLRIRDKRKGKIQRRKDLIEAKKVKKKLVKEKERKPKRRWGWDHSKKDVEDFKKRVVKEFKVVEGKEKEMKESKKASIPPDDNKDEGLFNMFD